MKRFVLSAEADHDLAEIAEQIGMDSLSSAERVIENLYSAMGRLAKSPGIDTGEKSWPTNGTNSCLFTPI